MDMDMEQGDSMAGYKAQRMEQDRRRLVAQTDADRRIAALELALKYEVEQREAAAERREAAAERHRKLITDVMIQRNDASDRAVAATVRADNAERELALATDRLKHILCCDGNLALCEWSAHAGQWLELRDGMAFGELLHQIDDDRLLTERQARDAWEARQADEIAQIAARNAARRAA